MVANLSEQSGVGALAGRTVYIPQMSHAVARLMAAAFRAIGIDAETTPASSGETLELGGQCSSGEECLPHKITLGDFLRITQQPGFDPAKAAFFMPRASGPCRFGQYAPYLEQVLRERGLGEVVVFAPSSADNYAALGDHASEMMRLAWLAVVLGDTAMRLLHKTRPYETQPGAADETFTSGVDDLAGVLSRRALPLKARLPLLVEAVARLRDRFRAVPARYEKGRPLIGLVGEIFCRLNTFSNDDVARRIEQLGGECWLSDISEWVWYINWCSEADAVRDGGRFSASFLKAKLKSYIQQRYERELLAPVEDDLRGTREPHDIREILRVAEPYLPATGALGEMTLSAGKAVYLYEHGADGILDISPFTCMNGVVSEAVYPAISAAHDEIPIRSLYFDKVNTNLERDLEIFLDLARAYQRRKRRPRSYPPGFE